MAAYADTSLTNESYVEYWVPLDKSVLSLGTEKENKIK
jgi:hypothetical protein